MTNIDFEGRRVIQVGNVGDSTTFLARGGEAVWLSQDHNVTNPVEAERLKVCGNMAASKKKKWKTFQ